MLQNARFLLRNFESRTTRTITALSLAVLLTRDALFTYVNGTESSIEREGKCGESIGWREPRGSSLSLTATY